MNDERNHFLLSCKDATAPAPVLTGVQAEGRLDAVLFELTLRQTYRNTSERVLEVVYTFPLPFGAVLLGFASELDGQRQQGVIVARQQAEQQYEQSLEAGDAPVMLEALGNGLHTANIGNLKPGEQIVLECRFAQLLGFDQGRVRVAIPTTIAPRYGNAQRAGLQAQQVPVASLDAEYPLALSLTIGESLAGAAIDCPTHRFSTRFGTDGSRRLELATDARLDRDVVVLAVPQESRPSLLVRAADRFDSAAPVVMMAALQPPPAVPRERIALKLLVDCSGSMAGDSIASARAALRGVVAGLGEADQLSLARFGSQVEHLTKPESAGPRTLQRLGALIDGIEADLGGTELPAALDAVFALRHGQEAGPADVLLITDGEVWEIDAMVAAAKRSGHRIFAIGVGASPAEAVLRRMADATGGACEFATPGEALEAAAQRMLHRMRQPRFSNVRIEWGGAPIWSSGPASSVFGGDTVIALAGFREPVSARGVRLLADDAQGHAIELARTEADAPCVGDSLARIAASRRLEQPGEAAPAALALRYQLMSQWSNCILVHERAAADKAIEPAHLHCVSSMLAAGWGGTGSVDMAPPRGSISPVAMHEACFDDASPPMAAAAAPQRPGRTRLTKAKAPMATPPAFGYHTFNLPFIAHLQQAGSRGSDGLAAIGDALSPPAEVRQALDELVGLGLNRDDAWLLLAHWLATRPTAAVDAVLPGLLKARVAALDPNRVSHADQVFERLLGAAGCAGLAPSRLQRLRQAMGGLSG